jgi:small subunit ribosomal protein S24e
MEIEISSRKENKILEREEVAFTLHFEGKTPSRKQVQQKLSDAIGRNVIVIEYIRPTYGASQATGYARGYTSAKQARAVEQQHILERNNLAGGGEPSTAEPKAEKEAPAEPEESEEESEAEPGTEG